MRIAAVASTLSGGGAARALVQVANHWAHRGRRVSILTLDGAENDFYELAPEIRRVGFDMRSPSRNLVEGGFRNIRRAMVVRRTLASFDPDVVVTVDQHPNALVPLAVVGLGVPVAVWEQIDPRRAPLSIAWRILRRVAYRLADRLVVQVDRLRTWAARYTTDERIRAIPNPAPPVGFLGEDGACELAELPGRETRTVLGVGRLEPQKGFDRLVDAFAAAAADRPDWRLRILGEGRERERLEERAVARDLGDRFELPGQTPAVGPHYANSDLFVLSSRFEGFPNVLLEAMVAGLPPLAFDCPTGPREIVRDGVDGILVPEGDVAELARQMGRLMDDADLRRRLGERAQEASDRFGMDRIGRMWDEVFDELV